MQERKVKTWNDASLFFVFLLLEGIAFYITCHNHMICFLICGLCFPLLVFAASYICFKLPIFHWATFSLYFMEDLPQDRIYHILRADEDGYILYNEEDISLLNIWLIDHPINKKKVKEIWNEL